jgi:hypothetical protein
VPLASQISSKDIDGVAVAGLFDELDAVVGQGGVDLVRHGLKNVSKELLGRLSFSCCKELSEGELGCPVNAEDKKELPFVRRHFADVNVEGPDGLAAETPDSSSI